MIVYKQERLDGIEREISLASVSAHCPLKLVEPFSLAKAKTFPAATAKANEGQPDLHYLEAILATAGCNLNDDVFDKAEMWAARATPIDKPFNYEHQQNDIIGHITDCRAVAEDNSAIADDAAVDDLPDGLSLVTQAVLYKVWEGQTLQDRMDKLIKEIAENKWYVSMEALFRDFDYVLFEQNGPRVVARNKETAFLSKHLRVYKGSGTYNGVKIGRLLRRFVFSGKGLVRNPANPGSVILSSHAQKLSLPQHFSPLSEVFVGQNKEKKSPLESSLKHSVYQNTEATQTEHVMSQELQAEVTRLQKALAEVDQKKVSEKIDTLTADLKATADKATSLEKQLGESKALAAGLESKLTEAVKANEGLTKTLSETQAALKVAQDELANISQAKTRAERIAALKAALSIEKDEDAAKLVDGMAGLDDAAFAAVLQTNVDYINSRIASAQTTQTTAAPAGKKLMNFGGTTLPNQATVVTAPQTTNVTSVTAQKALANPQVEQTAALATPAGEDRLQKVQAEILEYLGVKVDE